MWKKPSYLQQITMKKFLLFYLFFICRFFNEFLLHTRCILFFDNHFNFHDRQAYIYLKTSAGVDFARELGQFVMNEHLSLKGQFFKSVVLINGADIFRAHWTTNHAHICLFQEYNTGWANLSKNIFIITYMHFCNTNQFKFHFFWMFESHSYQKSLIL